MSSGVGERQSTRMENEGCFHLVKTELTFGSPVPKVFFGRIVESSRLEKTAKISMSNQSSHHPCPLNHVLHTHPTY